MAFKTVLEFNDDLPNLRSWDTETSKEWFRDTIASACTSMENTANTIQLQFEQVTFQEDYPYRCLEFSGPETIALTYQEVPINQTMSFKHLIDAAVTHRVFLLDGTFDGVNDAARFISKGNCLIVHFDSQKNGTVIINEGVNLYVE